MRYKTSKIKRIATIGLIFLFSINSFAAIVSDNDGSAFITKAEFEAMKSSFVEQIDSYNKSIDGKIDGSIASYLAGIKLSTEETLAPLLTDSVKFINTSFLLTKTRMRGATALTGVLTNGAGTGSVSWHTSGCKGSGGTWSQIHTMFYDIYGADSAWETTAGETRGHCLYYTKKNYGGTEYKCPTAYWPAIRCRIWESYCDVDSWYGSNGLIPKLQELSGYTELGTNCFDFKHPVFASNGGDAAAVGCYLKNSLTETKLENVSFWGTLDPDDAQYVRNEKYKYIVDESWHVSIHNDGNSYCVWKKKQGEYFTLNYMRYKSEEDSLSSWYANLPTEHARGAVKVNAGVPLYEVQKEGHLKMNINLDVAAKIQLKTSPFTTWSNSYETATSLTNLSLGSSGMSFANKANNYINGKAGENIIECDVPANTTIYLKPTQEVTITVNDATLKIAN